MTDKLQDFLDHKYIQYNRPDFITLDPVSIPHLFTKKQDIEIMGFWASILAWGQRKTIINKCKELIELMEGEPHNFMINHSENDLKRFIRFVHRTFNATDALYFIQFFHAYYQQNESLENAFLGKYRPETGNIGSALDGFSEIFFDSPDFPGRTKKHIASPNRKSACKRINMFLRWMVRKDEMGVDFGIWSKIDSAHLVCPCDLHVDRVGRKLGLITRKQTDWLTAIELTENLKKFDPNDPVKYDFALFGLGIEEKF